MQLSSIIMLVLLLLVFYFMLIRPENKRKKAAEQMRSSLKKGDRVTTIGGIVGKIVRVDEDTIVIETSEDRVRVELTKWAVSTTGVQTAQAGDSNKKKKGGKQEIPAETSAKAEKTDSASEPQENVQQKHEENEPAEKKD